MGKLTVETCAIEGLKVVTPEVRGDARGYFMETYSKPDFEEIGLNRVELKHAIENIGSGKKEITSASRHWLGMNSSSILEPIMKLYNITKEKRYLDLELEMMIV